MAEKEATKKAAKKPAESKAKTLYECELDPGGAVGFQRMAAPLKISHNKISGIAVVSAADYDAGKPVKITVTQ